MSKKKVSLYVKHSIVYYVYEILRWSSVLTPFLVLYLQKKDKWFVNVEGNNATTKMTVGMVLLIGILGWVILREMAKKKGRSHAPSVVSGIIWWGIAFALTYCFKTIINDLSTIILYGLIGQCAGAIWELLAQGQHERRQLYRSAEINANVYSNTFNKTTTNKKGVIPYE